MSAKHILGSLGLVGFVLALSSCEPLCRRGELFKEQGNWLPAVDEYEQCLQKPRSKKQQEKIKDEVERLKVRITDDVISSTRREIGTTDTVTKCDRAISLLEAKSKYDDEKNRIADEIESYRARRQELVAEIRQALNTADEQSRDQLWKEALSSVTGALLLDPDNDEALARQLKIIAMRDDYYVQAIRKTCENEDWAKAESILEKFRREEPAPLDTVAAPLLTLITETRQKAVRRQAQRLIEQKKYFTAHTAILDAKAAHCDDLLETIREQGSKSYVNLAREEKRNIRDSHAYIASVKAKELSENNETFGLHRDCADQMSKAIQAKIGIAEFTSPTNQPDVGREFSDALISHLDPLLPYGVAIEEREKIDFEKLKTPDGLREIVRLLGLNMAIFGDFFGNTVTIERVEEDPYVWVKVPKLIENPRFEAEFQALLGKYGSDKSRWPYEPKQVVEAEVSEKISYKKGTVTMICEMAVSVRVYSQSEEAGGAGSISKPKHFLITEPNDDTFQDAVPEANIPRDPLELPPEISFKRKVWDKMVGEVGDWILAKFDQRHKRFYEKAQYYIGRQEFDPAVEALAKGYLYCVRANVPKDDEWFLKIRQLAFYDLTE